MSDKLFEGETSRRTPVDSTMAFAHLVGKCAEGFGRELLEKGKTDTEARNAIIGYFLDFAAGEACRIARREQREPDPEKWRNATTKAFERAITRTAQPADTGSKSRQHGEIR